MSKPKVRYFCSVINRPKMLFESEQKANNFIKFNEDEIKRGGKKKFKHLRAYYCISCGGWHITSLALTPEQIQAKDKRIESMIDRSRQPKQRYVLTTEEKALNYIKTFDLLSFGSKKHARKYFSDNRDKFPTGVNPDMIFHILKYLPTEYFTSTDLRDEPSDEEIEKKVDELVQRLPMEKLTDSSLLLNYIEWEFQYKENIKPIVLIKLKKRLKLIS